MNFLPATVRKWVDGLRIEFWPMARLAGPVVLSEISWISLGVVDTIMIGRVGPEEIGAVSIGHSITLFTGFFGFGVLLGLDFLVAKAFGAGKLRDCYDALINGVYLSIILAFLLIALNWGIIFFLPYSGMQQPVLGMVIAYLKPTSFSVLPLLLYATFRRYLQARNIVKPIMIILFVANAVNALANWLLIFGNWGFPALYSTGAGYATLISMSFLCLSLLGYLIYYERKTAAGLFESSFRPQIAKIKEIYKLGLPAAIQITLEVGAFTAAAILSGYLNAISMAAHQIVMKLAALTFMVPLGISSAGAVRVGQAYGRQDSAGIVRSGWTALFFASLFMTFSGIVFILIPAPLIGVFTIDQSVITAGAALIFVAAIFQLSDGIQVAATGVLRGIGDTRTSMVVNLIGHWLLGMPAAYYITFVMGVGVQGLWIGLCIGLIFVAIVLLIVWQRASSRHLADALLGQATSRDISPPSAEA